MISMREERVKVPIQEKRSLRIISVDGQTEVHDVFILHDFDWLLEFKISRYLRSARSRTQ
jgi:hypothetical protein